LRERVELFTSEEKPEMSASDTVIETRDVSDFDRVALTGFGELVITQGEEESLAIEAPQDILARIETEVKDGRLLIGISRNWVDWLGDVLTAGFTGKRVGYNVTVKQLTGLEILGAARVKVANVKTDRLALELRGAADVSIESLEAERLDVDMPGAGKISVAGRVADQTVTVSGAGSYDAPKLESQRARAALEGIGNAIVWATEELVVTIRGVGSVSYYGTPEVSKELTGPGSVRSLGNPQRGPADPD
jgi:hypothetical protein